MLGYVYCTVHKGIENHLVMRQSKEPGNTKGGSITVPLTSYLTGLESAEWQLSVFVFICKTDSSKPVRQEVNGTVILPSLVFPERALELIEIRLHNWEVIQNRSGRECIFADWNCFVQSNCTLIDCSIPAHWCNLLCSFDSFTRLITKCSLH
jgi:hypothetical protein